MKKFMCNDDVLKKHAIDSNDLENFVYILHHRCWQRKSEIIWRKKKSDEKNNQMKMFEIKCAQKKQKKKRKNVRSKRWMINYIQH